MLYRVRENSRHMKCKVSRKIWICVIQHEITNHGLIERNPPIHVFLPRITVDILSLKNYFGCLKLFIITLILYSISCHFRSVRNCIQNRNEVPPGRSIMKLMCEFKPNVWHVLFCTSSLMMVSQNCCHWPFCFSKFREKYVGFFHCMHQWIGQILIVFTVTRCKSLVVQRQTQWYPIITHNLYWDYHYNL